MKKEAYLSKKPFAGPKKPSMKRRCAGHDYTRLTKSGDHPEHGYNDRILKSREQLPIWRRYLRDNPRRLLMKLLLLAPWEHHNEKTAITRSQCLSLNELARLISL